VGDDFGLPGRRIEGGLGFIVPAFAVGSVLGASEAGRGLRPSGKGGSGSSRNFGEADEDREEGREEGGTRWFPLGDV
jgi:hypothetical protein